MGVIYVSSTDRGAYDASLRLMLRVAQWATPSWQIPVDVGAYFPLNNALRKLAHVLFFGIFTLLAVRAVQWGSPHPMFAGKMPPPPGLVAFFTALNIRIKRLFSRQPKGNPA